MIHFCISAHIIYLKSIGILTNQKITIFLVKIVLFELLLSHFVKIPETKAIAPLTLMPDFLPFTCYWNFTKNAIKTPPVLIGVLMFINPHHYCSFLGTNPLFFCPIINLFGVTVT